MIVACPECGTRYTVADAALGAASGGRRLRCANCRRVWQYALDGAAVASGAESAAATAPPAVSATPAAPEALPSLPAQGETEPAQPSLDRSLREEPSLDQVARAPANAESSPAPPDPLARPSVAAEPPARGHRHVVWAAALGAAALAAALVLAVILGRDRIETLLPSTAPLYAMLHLDAPGAGLKVTVVPIRHDDALVISGDIVNAAAAPRLVPKLRLTLLDAKQTDLVSKVIDPPVARLPPGAKAHVHPVFEHPATAAVRVNVTYAAD